MDNADRSKEFSASVAISQAHSTPISLTPVDSPGGGLCYIICIRAAILRL